MLRKVKSEKPCILVLDDAMCVRQSLRFLLRDDFHVLTAPGPMEGQFYLTCHSVDVVLLDIKLRDTDGMALLAEIKSRFPFIEIIMITAHASLNTIREAIRLGASDYLIKPFDTYELLSVIQKALSEKKTRLAMKNDLDRLRESALYMEHLIRRAKDTVMGSSENAITAMLLNINSRDGYTWAHVRRVTYLSALIAEKMGLPHEQIQWVKCSAFIHDIGKVKLDEDILKKESRFTVREYEIMKKHPDKGAEIISPLPFLERAIQPVRHHHERYDGAGYPDGLAGKNIPLMARILAIADAVDSMIHSPVRQKPYAAEKVKQELQLNAGKQFDPEIVDVVLSEELLSFA